LENNKKGNPQKMETIYLGGGTVVVSKYIFMFTSFLGKMSNVSKGLVQPPARDFKAHEFQQP